MSKVQIQDLQGDWYDITGPIPTERAKRIVKKSYGDARMVPA